MPWRSIAPGRWRTAKNDSVPENRVLDVPSQMGLPALQVALAIIPERPVHRQRVHAHLDGQPVLVAADLASLPRCFPLRPPGGLLRKAVTDTQPLSLFQSP